MATAMADHVTFGSVAPGRWARVQVETEGATYVGRIHVPGSKARLSDLLCDERPFVSLTEVSVNESETLEAFIAINKHSIRTVRILHEDKASLRGS
ncbi:MAG TPA: hypothetical protein VN083_11740 [Vicinamibacteria bacterium]|jgi:hypothetical protein|nr:hypothetical protein [Vicinamibacteria bacterium]